MKLVRSRSFETNSSSCHTIVCSPEKCNLLDLLGYYPEDLEDPELMEKHNSLPDAGPLIALPLRSYGWGYEELYDLVDFADYCFNHLWDGEVYSEDGGLRQGDRLAMYFNLILQNKMFCFKPGDEIDIYDYGIDHQSLGDVESLDQAAAILRWGEMIVLSADG